MHTRLCLDSVTTYISEQALTNCFLSAQKGLPPQHSTRASTRPCNWNRDHVYITFGNSFCREGQPQATGTDLLCISQHPSRQNLFSKNWTGSTNSDSKHPPAQGSGSPKAQPPAQLRPGSSSSSSNCLRSPLMHVSSPGLAAERYACLFQHFSQWFMHFENRLNQHLARELLNYHAAFVLSPTKLGKLWPGHSSQKAAPCKSIAAQWSLILFLLGIHCSSA